MTEKEKILTALSEWSPVQYGQYRVVAQAAHIDASETRVVFNGYCGAIMDFARIQECFTETFNETIPIIINVKIICSIEEAVQLNESQLPGTIVYCAIPENLYAAVKDLIPENAGVLHVSNISDIASVTCKRVGKARVLNEETQKWLLYSIAVCNQKIFLKKIQDLQKELPF